MLWYGVESNALIWTGIQQDKQESIWVSRGDVIVIVKLLFGIYLILLLVDLEIMLEKYCKTKYLKIYKPIIENLGIYLGRY